VQKFDKGKFFFRQYDQVVYEGKVKVDMLYYNQLLQKIDENLNENVQNAVIALYKVINEIYEFVNIEPEIYGRGINTTILDESIETSHRKLSKVVFEFLDNNFYRLSPAQRQDKYFEDHKELAKTLIAEGNTTEDAISFAVKAVVMENLIRHISFPFASWSRIKYLTEDGDYGAVFDQDKLVDLVDSFNKKIHAISKIVTTCL